MGTAQVVERADSPPTVVATLAGCVDAWKPHVVLSRRLCARLFDYLAPKNQIRSGAGCDEQNAPHWGHADQNRGGRHFILLINLIGCWNSTALSATGPRQIAALCLTMRSWYLRKRWPTCGALPHPLASDQESTVRGADGPPRQAGRSVVPGRRLLSELMPSRCRPVRPFARKRHRFAFLRAEPQPAKSQSAFHRDARERHPCGNGNAPPGTALHGQNAAQLADPLPHAEQTEGVASRRRICW